MIARADIVTAFDENYFPYAQVLIRSISRYSSRIIDLHLVVPSDFPIMKQLQLLHEYANVWNINPIFHPTNLLDNLAEVADLQSIGYINSSTYLKLFFGDLLTNIDRVIYIDPDALVMRDMDPLFEFRLEKPFAACFEYKPWGQELFNDFDTPYFNAGVFITSLNFWRESGVLAHSLAILKRFGQTRFMEQDILNRIFQDSIQYLPPTFNVFSEFFPHLQVLQHLQKPLIVHFAGESKPWNLEVSENVWVKQWRDIYFSLHSSHSTLQESRSEQILKARISFEVLSNMKRNSFVRTCWDLLPESAKVKLRKLFLH